MSSTAAQAQAQVEADTRYGTVRVSATAKAVSEGPGG